uniref:Solute carrier family 2, facilitated glucose transporter member 12 n=1 Tax=Malurus cyaneus samueli TaxID=2593467 RepID=A0A8C5TJM3_9PASS
MEKSFSAKLKTENAGALLDSKKPRTSKETSRNPADARREWSRVHPPEAGILRPATAESNHSTASRKRNPLLSPKPRKNPTPQFPPTTQKLSPLGVAIDGSAIKVSHGLLMGYELGLISGALLQMSSILALSCKEQEVIVSSLLFGALFASLTGGFLIDRFGRRLSIIIASSLLVVGSLIVLPYESYEILIVGRIAIGVSISLSSIATCVYIAEIAPQHRRGLLVSLNELMIVIGILVAYISNYAFASVSHGWKYMFGLVIPLGALQALAMYFLPPSPRFLVMKDNDEAARKVLERLRETSDATKELTVIKSSLKDEHQYSFLDLFRSKNNMRARVLVGLTLVFFLVAIFPLSGLLCPYIGKVKMWAFAAANS